MTRASGTSGAYTAQPQHEARRHGCRGEQRRPSANSSSGLCRLASSQPDSAVIVAITPYSKAFARDRHVRPGIRFDACQPRVHDQRPGAGGDEGGRDQRQHEQRRADRVGGGAQRQAEDGTGAEQQQDRPAMPARG